MEAGLQPWRVARGEPAAGTALETGHRGWVRPRDVLGPPRGGEQELLVWEAEMGGPGAGGAPTGLFPRGL